MTQGENAMLNHIFNTFFVDDATVEGRLFALDAKVQELLMSDLDRPEQLLLFRLIEAPLDNPSHSAFKSPELHPDRGSGPGFGGIVRDRFGIPRHLYMMYNSNHVVALN